ncbi:MAG TPA: thiamine phosphate synthase [Propionibacteriaceae bacterium]|nr:thiamine phosphate synthase [Propionibacteriaceae bacterium]
MTALMGLDARMRLARLYLCTDARQAQGDLAEFLEEIFAGGVDIVQIRQKGMDPDAELEALEVARTVALRHQALVCVNDSPELAGRFAADVLHLGQTDGPSATARRHLHRWAQLGRSTHSIDQVDAALADPDNDYFCVGPVYATATKPDYPAVGLRLVRYAARIAPPSELSSRPWFAIGGINQENLDDVLAAGARRICVVRPITQAADPRSAAADLKQRLAAAWRADPGMQSYALAAAAGRGSARGR